MSNTLLDNGAHLHDLLARRLRRARKEAGLTQQQVADQIGLIRPHISKIETGNRRVEAVELACFAELYGKPMEWFFERASD